MLKAILIYLARFFFALIFGLLLFYFGNQSESFMDFINKFFKSSPLEEIERIRQESLTPVEPVKVTDRSSLEPRPKLVKKPASILDILDMRSPLERLKITQMVTPEEAERIIYRDKCIKAVLGVLAVIGLAAGVYLWIKYGGGGSGPSLPPTGNDKGPSTSSGVPPTPATDQGPSSSSGVPPTPATDQGPSTSSEVPSTEFDDEDLFEDGPRLRESPPTDPSVERRVPTVAPSSKRVVHGVRADRVAGTVTRAHRVARALRANKVTHAMWVSRAAKSAAAAAKNIPCRLDTIALSSNTESLITFSPLQTQDFPDFETLDDIKIYLQRLLTDFYTNSRSVGYDHQATLDHHLIQTVGAEHWWMIEEFCVDPDRYAYRDMIRICYVLYELRFTKL